MTGAKSFALQATAWERDPVEYTAESRLILDLYDREQIALRRYLVYLGLDSDSAAETVQESFLRLHQHLIAGGDRSNLRAWIYRVAHNLARNTQTAIRTTRTGSLTDAGHAEIVADSSASAEATIAYTGGRESGRERVEAIERCAKKLSCAPCPRPKISRNSDGSEPFRVDRRREHSAWPREVEGEHMKKAGQATEGHLTRDLLIRFLDGELPDQEFGETRGHLAVCSICRQKRDELAQLSSKLTLLVNALPVDVPVDGACKALARSCCQRHSR